MTLLDTCTLLWLAIDPERLSAAAREVIATSGEYAHVSAISAWEIAWKHRCGRPDLQLSPEVWFPLALDQHELRELSLTAAICLRMVALPDLHRDPVDRFLVATAQELKLTLVTPDSKIRQYPKLKTLW